MPYRDRVVSRVAVPAPPAEVVHIPPHRDRTIHYEHLCRAVRSFALVGWVTFRMAGASAVLRDIACARCRGTIDGRWYQYGAAIAEGSWGPETRMCFNCARAIQTELYRQGVISEFGQSMPATLRVEVHNSTLRVEVHNSKPTQQLTFDFKDRLPT